MRSNAHPLRRQAGQEGVAGVVIDLPPSEARSASAVGDDVRGPGAARETVLEGTCDEPYSGQNKAPAEYSKFSKLAEIIEPGIPTAG